jgi:ABC-type transporter Mla MlaB component
MPIRTAYTERENRLDLSVIGNLDLTLSQAVCDLCARLPATLQCCVIDLSDVERVFDSGVALLHMLHRRLRELGTAVVIHGDEGDVGRRIPGYLRQS